MSMRGAGDVLGDLETSCYPDYEKFACQAEILSVFAKRGGEVWGAIHLFLTFFARVEPNISTYY